MTQRIAEWEHSKWLLLSSFLFLIPTVYGLYKELYVWSIMLCITTIISANYWRDACVGWRRDLDLWYAKLMFIVFCSAMVYYVDYEPYAIFGYTAFFVILFMYYKSAQAHYYKYAHWWMYHVGFHILLTIEELIILDSII